MGWPVANVVTALIVQPVAIRPRPIEGAQTRLPTARLLTSKVAGPLSHARQSAICARGRRLDSQASDRVFASVYSKWKLKPPLPRCAYRAISISEDALPALVAQYTTPYRGHGFVAAPQNRSDRARHCER